MKEPKFYLNTEYVKLIKRESATLSPYIPSIEFKKDMIRLSVPLQIDWKGMQCGMWKETKNAS